MNAVDQGMKGGSIEKPKENWKGIKFEWGRYK